MNTVQLRKLALDVQNIGVLSSAPPFGEPVPCLDYPYKIRERYIAAANPAAILELLEALKEAKAGMKMHEESRDKVIYKLESVATREKKLKAALKRANDMINNSYQCECGNPKTPCPCLEGFLDNIQAILDKV